MVVTIAVIIVGMVVLAGIELWLFWVVGERDDRRRGVTPDLVRSREREPSPVHTQRSARAKGTAATTAPV